MGSCDPHEHWRGIIVSGFWPNTDWQTKKSSSLIQAYIRFKSSLVNKAQKHCSHFEVSVQMKHKKMQWIFFLLRLSLSHIKKKLSFASPLRHRKSVDLPPDRAGGGWGVGSGRNSQPQQFILKWCPLGTKKNSIHFILFLQLSTACRSHGCSTSTLAIAWNRILVSRIRCVLRPGTSTRAFSIGANKDWFAVSCDKSLDIINFSKNINSTVRVPAHTHTHRALKMTILINQYWVLKSPKRADRAARLRDSGVLKSIRILLWALISCACPFCR